MRLVVLLVLLGGCHALFDLEQVADRDGGLSSGDGKDGAGSDPDARIIVCPMTIAHDEDGDSIDDSCDACPTIASDTVDDDGDGLPNACDPGIIPIADGGEKILFYATFGDASDRGGFAPSTASYLAQDDGVIVLGANQSLTTIDSFTPTRVELRIDGFTVTNTAAAVTLSTDFAKCAMKAISCDNTDPLTTSVSPSSSGCGDVSGTSASMQMLLLDRGANSVCTMSSGGGIAAVIGSDSPGTSTIRVGASTEVMAATVRSIVIYGAK